jgi:AcrR family transcriptional regulator
MTTNDTQKCRTPDGSPRRVRLRPEQRRGLLLDAAAAEFLARGYGATTMRDIAARAGVTAGLIYRYFPGKYEMLGALATERGPSTIVSLLEESWDHLSLREFLTEALRQIVSAFASHRETILIMETQRLTDTDIAALLEYHRARGVAALTTYLETWSARGRLRRGVERRLAWSLIALAEGFFLDSATPPDNAAPSPAALDRFATETAAMLEAGCRPG